MKQRKYETMIIVRPSLTEEQVNGLIKELENLVKENGGSVIEDTTFEKKPLKYVIKKEVSAYYLIMNYEVISNFNHILIEKLRFNRDILRYMPLIKD